MNGLDVALRRVGRIELYREKGPEMAVERGRALLGVDDRDPRPIPHKPVGEEE